MGNLRQSQTKKTQAQDQSLVSGSRKLTYHPIEELQGIIGNRALGNLIKSQPDLSRQVHRSQDPLLNSVSPISGQSIQRMPRFRGLSHELRGNLVQAKLTIGEAGDKYELEADRVASEVVDRINAPVSSLSTQPNSIQAQQEQDELMRKPMVQLQSNEGGMAATPELESSIQQARGSGMPIAESIRKPMEQSFGADFSGVRVHADAQSDQLNQSIQARAFTTGKDIFFRQGEYNPGSKGGQELIAHELTHVVQQGQGDFSQLKPKLPKKNQSLKNFALSSANSTVQRKPGDLTTHQEWNKKFDENPLWNNLEYRHHSWQGLNIQNVRKVNRISGIIKRKFSSFPKARSVVEKLDNFIITRNLIYIGNITEEDLELKDYPTPKELEYNRLIAVAVNVVFPNDKNLEKLNEIIKKQWATIEGSELKVIAHRGDGATFDKMGKYTDRESFNKLYPHENENSEQSTVKFLQSWLKDGTFLSGIECDIFLTKDGVPYVTHTKNVEALLDQEARLPEAQWRKNTDIKDIESRLINPRFLKLSDWLKGIDQYLMEEDIKAQVNGVMTSIFDSPKKLRIEIEMKQDVFSNPFTKGFWLTPNKVVSKFLKETPNSHFYEVAMFNNSDVPAYMHEKSKAKTYLSHVTYGKGGDPTGADNLPEVRFGLHQRGLLDHINSGKLDGKVVTFAPGLNHPGGDKLGQQLKPVGWPKSEIDMTIEQSIQNARLEFLWEAIINRKTTFALGPVSVHILTDHGNKGAEQIINRGLAVGWPDTSTWHSWNADTITRKYPQIDSDFIKDVLNKTILVAKDPKEIGKMILQKYPVLI